MSDQLPLPDPFMQQGVLKRIRALLPAQREENAVQAIANGQLTPLAVALSGGPDSMALLHVLRPAMAYIVDHGLRIESSQEAQRVQARAQALGVQCKILRWDGPKPHAAIMEKARLARYQILSEACRRDGFGVLCLAHHLDDQIETYLMRAEMGSGWRGLAGMPRSMVMGGVTFVRPWLDVRKNEIESYVLTHRLDVVRDPSNENMRFKRAAVRAALSRQHDPQRDEQICAILKQNAQRREDEQLHFRAILKKFGERIFSGGWFLSHDEEGGYADFSQRQAFWGQMLMSVGQNHHPIKQEKLSNLLYSTLKKPESAASIAGCLIKVVPKNKMWAIVREPFAISPLEIEAGHHNILWDHRLRLIIEVPEAGQIGPLAGRGWRHLDVPAVWQESPSFVRASFPLLVGRSGHVKALIGQEDLYFHPFHQKFWYNGE